MLCPYFVVPAEDGTFTRKGRCDRNGMETYAENNPSWCPLIGTVSAAEFAAHQEEDLTPPHYAGTVTPWDLERCMVSSGNAFVDSRRTDAIEYCFRMKGDLKGDLKKAKHCIESAIEELEKQQNNIT